MNYIDTIENRTKEYFEILEPQFPLWLNEYINTKELLKQQYISVTCGTIYSQLFENKFFYSSLDHSIAVALIVWHFTHDKKQTLAGLFHDIATPAFKHCIDFLNGDYIKQESTEDLTSKIIENSVEIMELLKRDKIKLEEVDNYHIYPIADNDTPKLSADRLEYSLSNALLAYGTINDIEVIKRIYNDLEIGKDEEQIDELSFKTETIAEEFVEITSKLSIMYREDKTRYSMQLIADIIKKMNEDGLITKKDLYELQEKEVIDIIKKSKYKKVFEQWQNAKEINISRQEPRDVYFVHHGAKVRYINPLVSGKRISEVSEVAKNLIEENLKYKMDNYVFLDFDII